VLYSAIVWLFVVALAPIYEGHGILNQISIGKDYNVDQISEIEDYWAVYVEAEHGDGLVHFVLELKDGTQLNGLDGGLAPRPFLTLMRKGKAVAVIWPRVEKGVDDKGWSIEWKVSAEFDQESYFRFQVIHDERDFSTIKLPFSAARSSYVTAADRKSSKMNYSELRKKLNSETR